ncbi:hypothetical protein [Okeania sp.]|nr:hypothetical protein [Okeania sp.]MEB3342637.1 hypothetical protein [Okeania sp.]
MLNIELKEVIIKVLEDYIEYIGNDPEMQCQLVIDETRNHYLLI